MSLPTFTQTDYLSILSRADADTLKLLVESIIPTLEPISVVYNRTGLVMLPYTDSAQGSVFHLGEVLIAEARVQIAGRTEGYGVCLGLDLEQALAIALCDAALTAGIGVDALHAYLNDTKRALDEADDALLKAVEATRAEMETF